MHITHSKREDKKSNHAFSRKSECLHALPILSYSFVEIENQKIQFNKETNKRFGLEKKPINLAHYNYEIIREVITTCINESLITTQEVSEYIKKLEDNSIFGNTLLELENKIKIHFSNHIIQSIDSLKIKLNSLGYDFSNEINGTLHYENQKTNTLKFTINDILLYWVINVNNMDFELQNIIASTARLCGNTAKIDTLCYCISDDEIFYTISNLSKKTKNALFDSTIEEHHEDIFKTWLNILGETKFQEIVETYEEYYDWDINCEESKCEMEKEITKSIKSVQLSEHRFFSDEFNFNMNTHEKLIDKINNYINISESEKSKSLANNIIKIINHCSQEYTHTEYDFEYDSDLNSIRGQQVMHFEGQEHEEISVERLENIGNYLMETGEKAEMIIEPNNRECVMAFKNIQIGWLMISSLVKEIDKY